MKGSSFGTFCQVVERPTCGSMLPLGSLSTCICGSLLGGGCNATLTFEIWPTDYNDFDHRQGALFITTFITGRALYL